MWTHKILSTKKLEPELPELAAKQGLHITEQEFITTRPIWSEALYHQIHGLAKGGVMQICFTSANAVPVFERYMHAEDTFYVYDWKVCCLSGKTLEAVQQAHFYKKEIVATAENGSQLAEAIIAAGMKEIGFICGNRRRDELPRRLAEAGITVHEIVVYETLETPRVAEDYEGILFFSPSGVDSFFSVNGLKEGVVCFAIGQTTADRIGDYTDNRVIVSPAPSQQSLLGSVQFYFDNSSCYE